jgi:uncharacterized membrane protein
MEVSMSPFWSGVLGALAALFVLVAVRRIVWFAFWRRRWHRHGHGHGPGGFARRGLGHLFRRLGTRPDQEPVLQAEVEALLAEMSGFRGEAFALREELAVLLASPSLEEAAVSAALEKPLARLAELRARAAAAVARIHATLDAAQRERLAQMVRHGPRHGHHRGHGPRPAMG